MLATTAIELERKLRSREGRKLKINRAQRFTLAATVGGGCWKCCENDVAIIEMSDD